MSDIVVSGGKDYDKKQSFIKILYSLVKYAWCPSKEQFADYVCKNINKELKKYKMTINGLHILHRELETAHSSSHKLFEDGHDKFVYGWIYGKVIFE